MNKFYKKRILIDFDGVLNNYTGNFNENYIPPIKEGALEFIQKLSEKFEIKIFTSRKLLLVAKWVFENKLESYICDITNIKEPCYLIIDDRCIKFDGNYEKTVNKIEQYMVWYKSDNN